MGAPWGDRHSRARLSHRFEREAVRPSVNISRLEIRTMAARKKIKKKASDPSTRAPKARAEPRKRVLKAASSVRGGGSVSGGRAAEEASASIAMAEPVLNQTRSAKSAPGTKLETALGASIAMEMQNDAPAPEPATAMTRQAQASAEKPTRSADETNAPAATARAPVAAKPTKAATPTKTTERDEQGGEQKTMKNNPNRLGFKLNEFVVYPAHGVGQIVALEEQEVAGFRLELFVINFTKDKMTLRVPTSKVSGVGMRKLSDPDAARRSLDILTGRARIKRTMWSRRAQEYEAKINSGDINAIAEVVRDLYRSDAQPEQSYSERQLYEAALDRMMREIAAVQKLSETEALKVIDGQLKKNQKRAAKSETPEGEDPEIEEAA